MLSHVWYAKDIKTALLAADVIINKWGFKDYRLDIYGALDKSPAYSTACQEIIATKSLRHNVRLQGEAEPMDVLEKTVGIFSAIPDAPANMFKVGIPQLLNI
jgi:hypothetical protein